MEKEDLKNENLEENKINDENKLVLQTQKSKTKKQNGKEKTNIEEKKLSTKEMYRMANIYQQKAKRIEAQAYNPHGWSWGAFALSAIWGFGNSVWKVVIIPIVFAFIPVVGLKLSSSLNIIFTFGMPILYFIWKIICGIKGHSWAWNNFEYNDVDIFEAVQRSWDKAGLITFVFYICLGIFAVIFSTIIISIISNIAGQSLPGLNLETFSGITNILNQN